MTIGRGMLNDLDWHTVYMSRRGDTLTLKIDNNDPSAGKQMQHLTPVYIYCTISRFYLLENFVRTWK